MAETTARAVADYLIAFSHEHGDPITNLKLQKLLYYAQAWYLALYDGPLFEDRIEAWVYGPVVPSVYQDFKTFRWQPIPLPVVEPDGLSQKVKDHLHEVMDNYGDFTAYYLERLTHSEDPWKNARGSLPPDADGNEEIRRDDMASYYGARALVTD